MAQADDPAAGPVWFDLEHEQLRRGDKPLHLRPKSFALLRYLVAHPGRVLSKDQLVEAVWPKTAISDGVLTVAINEVRHALGDMAQAPQYLETVPRRGYRWRGTLPTTAPPMDPVTSRPGSPLAPPTTRRPSTPSSTPGSSATPASSPTGVPSSYRCSTAATATRCSSTARSRAGCNARWRPASTCA